MSSWRPMTLKGGNWPNWTINKNNNSIVIILQHSSMQQKSSKFGTWNWNLINSSLNALSWQLICFRCGKRGKNKTPPPPPDIYLNGIKLLWPYRSIYCKGEYTQINRVDLIHSRYVRSQTSGWMAISDICHQASFWTLRRPLGWVEKNWIEPCKPCLRRFQCFIGRFSSPSPHPNFIILD